MHVYAIALGSNRRHGRHGSPEAILAAALMAMAGDMRVAAISPPVATPAMGHRGRRFANAAAVVETNLPPPALLARLKQLERAFGRRRGRRWGPRVLDLDILLWSGGRWRSRAPVLTIPHPELLRRRFVLDPLVRIAPHWPLPGGTIRIAHAHARLTAPRPLL